MVQNACFADSVSGGEPIVAFRSAKGCSRKKKSIRSATADVLWCRDEH